MKLLFTIDELGSGGAQRQMVTLARGLVHRGHQVDFFLYYPQDVFFRPLLTSAGIQINEYQKQARFTLGPIGSLRRLMSSGRYDLALSFLPTPSFYAEMARLRLDRCPLVVSERNMYTGERLRVGEWLLQQCHRVADHITVNSHHQRIRMELHFPWMKRKISTIYNGVNLEVFCPSQILTSPQAGNTLLAVGSVLPTKNPRGLALGLAALPSSIRQRYTIAWAGRMLATTRSLQEKAETDTVIASAGLEDVWCWLGEQPDIISLLHQCVALIHPSYYEGLPNAICEALACGKPVLCSDIGDHSRIVQDGISGFLFDPGKPHDIARAITRFASLTVTERDDMGNRARAWAENNLGIEHYLDQYESLFVRLIYGSRS